MTFKFHCVHCGQRISAHAEDVGTEGTCPACSGTFIVPIGMVEGSSGVPGAESGGQPKPSTVSLPPPAPHPPTASRVSASEMLAQNEAASAKRTGYFVIAGVVLLIGAGAIFLNLPKKTPSSILKYADGAASPTPAASQPAVKDAAAKDGEGGETKPDTERLPPEERQVMGGSRRTVDALMAGEWNARPTARKTDAGETVMYESGLQMIVEFKEDRAVGVSIAVRGKAEPIDRTRYFSLVRLIGQAPKDENIQKDPRGILGFKVGEI